ncbi:MAG: glycosyltransferase [Candidatus Dormibacteraeota bacterium]|nr:glycosyltransferase [Candidatus Dormibacteraeota bacterium]
MWARGEPASVLVLYSDTGGGHRAAAKALVAALKEVDPSVRVATCDPLMGEGSPAVRKVVSSYPWIITQAQPLWGVIYHATNTRPTWVALRTSFTRQVRQAVGRKLDELDPDLVVSVHPLVTQPAWRAIQRSGRRRGLMTVVTDLVDIHRSWAFPNLDRLVVPTLEAWEVVTGYGVPRESVQLLGLPVDLRFRPPEPDEPETLRRRWGLSEGRPTVLVMGGGEGSGRLLQQVRALAWLPHDWQVIAVCGRNERLRRRLSRLHFRTPTLVLGFVDTVPELLRASDLVVTKAGPGAIAEALATHVPMVLTGHLPGQEAPNVRFVTHTGVGLHAPRPDMLQLAVDYLLADGGVEARAMSRRAAEIAHPHAALDIARECLALAARYGAASQARR